MPWIKVKNQKKMPQKPESLKLMKKNLKEIIGKVINLILIKTQTHLQYIKVLPLIMSILFKLLYFCYENAYYQRKSLSTFPMGCLFLKKENLSTFFIGCLFMEKKNPK